MKVEDDDLIFSNDSSIAPKPKRESWKVMIVDDDKDIHEVTKFVLKNFEFGEKNLEFVSAYSSQEAKLLINEHPDTALILLDVVMEEEDSGLKFVRYLREELQNHIVRIILRTGQPGVAPQAQIVIDYDINDYKEKTELTKEKFFSAIVIALRSFETLKSLQISLHELESSSKAAERFVPHDFLKILNKKRISEVRLGDYTVQKMSVLFMDIRRLVNMMEHLSPQKSVNLINSCLQYLEPAIMKQNGFLDKFVGDAIMAFFYGAPDNAIKASFAMMKTLEVFNAEILATQAIKMGIGIYTGSLTLGTVGSEDRMDVTALGKTVHMSTIIEKLNRHFKTRLLIGDETVKHLHHPEEFHFRWIANVKSVEKRNPFAVYEVFDMNDKSVVALKEETRFSFESALKDYVEKRPQAALEKFTQVLAINPKDEVAKSYWNLLSNE
jgi:adenylate cyclase